MILDATSLSHYQACPRRWLIESIWRPPKHRPKVLFERMLRLGIERLSSPSSPPADLALTIRDLRARFLGQCASPGLDLPSGANPFIIAKDWAMALDMILRTAKRSTLLTLTPVPPVALSSDVSWRVSALADDSGTLHRWLACDRWDQDELSRQAHGWWVFGDMAATRRSLMLHVVEVGQMRNGRRDSCWTRGFRHKRAPNLPLIFGRPDHRTEYNIEYLADLSRDDPEGWVDAIIKEGEAGKHLRRVMLECPSDEVCADTVRQMLTEAEKMRVTLSSVSPEQWSDVPMSRSACDGMVPCPWQNCCFQWPPPDPEDAGFVRLDAIAPQSVRLVPPLEQDATAPASVR